MRRPAAGLLLWLALLGCQPALADGRPGAFDFYVLALSWSPSFCAGARDAPQCGETRGLVVHGLWPQYERGWPDLCAEPGRLSAALVSSLLDIMPDRNLVRHEWEKHGTCSGLVPADYFALARKAFARIRHPKSFAAGQPARTLSAAAAEAAFVAENPGLTRDAIAVACDGGRLEEIRICLTRDLAFRPCREVDRGGCRQPHLTLPAAN
jgi:ribonuclease T2